MITKPQMHVPVNRSGAIIAISQPQVLRRDDAQAAVSGDAVVLVLGQAPHDPPAIAPPSGQVRGSGKLVLDRDSISLLFCMPFLSMLTCAYMYAALPLYFLDQSEAGKDWYTLTKLGLILLAGNVLRVLMTVATNKISDSVYLVQLSIAFGASLWMMFDPESITALVISMTLATSSNYILALHGLAFVRYNAHGSEQLHIRALRVLTTTEVLGYSIATLVGGVFYELGGWPACIWLQTSCLMLMLLCSLGSPTVRDDCREWTGFFGASNATDKLDSSTDRSHQASTKQEIVDQDRSTTSEQHVTALSLDYWPVILVLVAHSVNAASYTVEWSLFAAFFREEFGWSSSWTGAAQSSGDLLAAAYLLLQACIGGTRDDDGPSVRGTDDRDKTGSGETVPTCTLTWSLRSFSTYPFNLSGLLFVIAGLNFTIAQPSFICAVIAQVRLNYAMDVGNIVAHMCMVTCSTPCSHLHAASRVVARIRRC